MKTTIVAVLLTLLVVCAGCASPEDTGEEGDPDETPSPTDNDFGAEPVNPNTTNETEAPGTLNPPDNETGDEAGANETGATETTGTNESVGGAGAFATLEA